MEVHPPHHRVDNWRDALVHVALITVGLLIALGLESAASWMHHRHQRDEAMRAIAAELERNRESVNNDLRSFRGEAVAYRSDLDAFVYLGRHPGTAEDRLPTAIRWLIIRDPISVSAWNTAHESGVIAYFDPAEARRFDHLYDYFRKIDSAQADLVQAVMNARAYQLLDSDASHLSATQAQEQVQLCKQLLRAHYLVGLQLANLASEFPEFPSLGFDELHAQFAAPVAETPELKRLREHLRDEMKKARDKAPAGAPAKPPG
jgi:hypothetical protein